MTGHVVRLLVDKRFGFIKGEDSSDYFFHMEEFNGHWNDLAEDFETLYKQQHKKIVVEFDVAQTGKGLRANNVRRTDYPNEG